MIKTSELIFIGIKGTVVALDRTRGEQVWATHLKGVDFVNVVVDKGRILATCCGEVFCLDPITGNALWHNGLKGLGRGLATIATENLPGGNATSVLAQKRRLDEEQASAGAAAACA